jgi:CheY-like chemotaxis protein
MIADDTWTNQVALKNLINKLKYDKYEIIVQLVQDGISAVQDFSLKNQTKSPHNIHLIIMDLNMQFMNGDEATKLVLF